MSWLIDGGVLVTSVIVTHPLHQRALAWMNQLNDQFFTCAITEGTFLRLHMQFAKDKSARHAWAVLRTIQAAPNHRFVDDGFSYTRLSTKLIQGHKQVTDAWLAELARRHSAKLATLDTGLVATHPDVGVLLP